MSPATKTKPTYSKAPGRVVVADDLVISIAGVDYYPHKGESVTFRGSPSVSDSMAFMKYVTLGQSFDASASSVETLGELETLFDRVVGIIAKHVTDWGWTDPSGEPYESPPTVEALQALEPLELAWLVAALNNRQEVTQGEG